MNEKVYQCYKEQKKLVEQHQGMIDRYGEPFRELIKGIIHANEVLEIGAPEYLQRYEKEKNERNATNDKDY